jgi:hypothetical protein
LILNNEKKHVKIIKLFNKIKKSSLGSKNIFRIPLNFGIKKL